jgi:SOS response regulatory protein OraA/RecX
MPVDAERWLASRGITREPLSVPESDPGSAPIVPETSVPQVPHGDPTAPSGISAEHAEQASSETLEGAGPEGPYDEAVTSERTVAGALSFIRRSTSNAPQSEGRLRAKLRERGHPEEVIEGAFALARSERLVDDPALLAALILERRARGHADVRLRRDLRDRGFTGEQVDEALERHAATDPAAAVFALAREQAARHRAVDAEAAVRRTVGFLVRRGHGEALARKAARDAVYADREAQEVAGR